MCRELTFAAIGIATACGRVGFDPPGGDALVTDVGDGRGVDGALSPVALATIFVGRGGFSGNLDSFSTAALHAGDAVVLQVFCDTSTAPTSVSVTGTGWSFDQLGPLANSGTYWGTAFAAIAPNTAPANFTITWSGVCTFVDELGDEFTGNDPTGGTATFDQYTQAATTGSCTTSITTAHDGDAVWAACTTNSVTGPGSGFTLSADDTRGDRSQYMVDAGPAGTAVPISFATSPGTDNYVVTVVTIKPP